MQRKKGGTYHAKARCIRGEKRAVHTSDVVGITVHLRIMDRLHGKEMHTLLNISPVFIQRQCLLLCIQSLSAQACAKASSHHVYSAFSNSPASNSLPSSKFPICVFEIPSPFLRTFDSNILKKVVGLLSKPEDPPK